MEEAFGEGQGPRRAVLSQYDNDNDDDYDYDGGEEDENEVVRTAYN